MTIAPHPILKLLPRASLVAPLLALGLTLGCSSGAQPDEENAQQTAEALTAPMLVATPSAVTFVRTRVGAVTSMVVTITNRSSTPAINILPPDPYYPPDTYTVTNNPPRSLGAYGSGRFTIAFAPRAAGATSSTIALRYQDDSGAQYMLRIPVQGSAY